jgi:hypothetical protein
VKLFYSLLVFGLAFQIAAYLFYVFDFCPYISYPMSLDIANSFSLTPFDLAFVVAGGAAITIVSILLRAGTYALYALPIWVLTTFLPILKGFVTVIPNTLGALFGEMLEAINPLPAGTTVAILGVNVSNPLIAVLIGITGFGAFIFFLGLAAQRDF